LEDKEKLNILILSWRGPGHPNAGGAETSTHQHAKGWVKAGHQVTLFTSYYKGAKEEENIDGVRIVRQGSQIFGVHLRAFLWFTFKNRQKYDLVVDQFHGIPFFTPLYVKVKKLAFIHEVTKEVWSLNPWSWPFNLMPTLIGTIFEPLIFKLLYRKIPFMTVSTSTKKDLIKWGIPKENITVIHNGLEASVSKYSLSKEKKKTIVFLGALTKDKGIEDALKIFSIVDNTEDNFQFWIVGKGEPHYLEWLKLQTIKFKINDKVKFWGFVSEEKKFELLKRAHILINPSIREGWGLVVTEAARVGVPTVAFDVPGLRDSIIHGKTGILCKDQSIAALSKGILDLLKENKKYEKMSKAAYRWSRNFSWEKSTKYSLELIKSIVS